MRKYIKITSLLFAVLSIIFVFGCGDGGFDKYEGSLDEARAQVALAKDKLFDKNSLSLTYSYMVNAENDGDSYDLGVRNIIKILGDPETGSTDINRFNYYYGTRETLSDAYYYKDGKLYTELCNTKYCSTLSEEDFWKYTDRSRYALDREFFKLESFSKAFTKTEDGKTYIRFTEGDGELSRKIADFIGFDLEQYTYDMTDAVYTATILENGILENEKLTFEIKYAAVNAPRDYIIYNGEFYLNVDKTEEVKLNEPVITADTKEISDISLIENFIDKAFGVLSKFTTLDAEIHRFIKMSDIVSEYQLEADIVLTEAYRDGSYTYGSIDTQRYKTPKLEEVIKTGVFIDGAGYHYRSDDKNEDKAEPPYGALDMIAIVYQNLAGERPIESDITGVEISETEELWIYQFSFTDEIVRYYGEYLASMFSKDGAEVSFAGTLMSVEDNKTVIKVRKSDGCLVAHEIKYKVVFGKTITVESEYQMKINATGNDVSVLPLESWSK